jgi:hypothetical protein
MQERQLQELLERLDQTRNTAMSSWGSLVLNRMGVLWSSFLVFDGNHKQLLSALEKFQNPEFYLPTLDVQHPKRLDVFLQEVTQLLYNYVAAAISLADHTRVIANEFYARSPFLSEFQERVKQTFAELPVARFVHGLQSYMLHYRLPFPSSGLTAARDTNSGEWNTQTHLSLTVSELKMWTRWHSRALEYLDAAGFQIDLYQLATDYTSTVVSFHNWLRTKQREIHQGDFDELSRLLNAMHAVEAELERE